MLNKNFDSINYDYFTNTTSYVKMLLDMLPENKVSMEKKLIIKDLYNFFLNRYSNDKIKEIATISTMFSNKLAVSNTDDIARDVLFIYNTFLDKIIFNSLNRDVIFDIMNNFMKVYVGYYSEYQMQEQSRWDNIERGSNCVR